MKDKFLREALILSRSSNCLKTKIGVVLVKNDKVLAKGANICSPDQPGKCPRMSVKGGTQYELCKGIHAEVMACLSIRKRDPLEFIPFKAPNKPTKKQILDSFNEEELNILRGADLYLAGHFFMCDNCKFLLKTLGIKNIHFEPQSSISTQNKYEDNKLI